MLDFLKKILGLPTQEEINAAKNTEQIKIEPPIVNNKSGDLVDSVVVPKEVVNSQITDAVTQEKAPVKKARKPRTSKAEKTVKEKVSKVAVPATKRTAKKSKTA